MCSVFFPFINNWLKRVISEISSKEAISHGRFVLVSIPIDAFDRSQLDPPAVHILIELKTHRVEFVQQANRLAESKRAWRIDHVAF